MRRASSAAAVLILCALARADEDGRFWAELGRPPAARFGALVERAQALLEGGRPDAAEPLLEDAVALAPGDPLGFYLLGEARFRMRAWAGCADALATVVRLDPGFVRGGKPEPSLDRPDPREAVEDMLPLCLALDGRLDDAVAHYRRLLHAPGASFNLDALHGNLGDCYQAEGRLADAVDEYQAAIALSPRRAALHAALAVAYDRDERTGRAREAMARALAVDPNLSELASASTFFIPAADAHYYQGLAAEVAGQRQRAIAFFRKYLDVAAPDTPWLARARRHLLELGPPALRPDDAAVFPDDAPDGPALVKALVPGADLQACFTPGPRAVVRASLSFTPKAAPPTVSLATVGPDLPAAETLECLEKRLVARERGVRQPTRIQVAIGAR